MRQCSSGTAGGGRFGPGCSDRIPGPDEFFPFVWDWFFDDFTDPGPWVPGETIEFWVSFSQLEPGDTIEFSAFGAAPCGPTCASFGTVTVLPDGVPVLGTVGHRLLALLLISGVLAAQRAWPFLD